MENMKSLADQIREQLVKPAEIAASVNPDTGAGKTASVKKGKAREEAPIVAAILAYDNSANKSMVHARFDQRTVKTMNQFKMATGVDVTKLVSFAVKHLFETCPELKSTIKHFIQNNDL
jgi:arginine utilization protein RocB